MTQPLPDAAAQKQAAAEVFAQYEPPLYEAYLEMMLEWLAAVKAAMFTGGVARLGLIPDPIRVFSQGPKWAALTSQYTAKVAEEVLAAPYRDLFANGTLFESRPFVRNWIAQRENRLSRVPDEVFGAVSKIIDSATTNGASIPDVAAQVEQLFDGTDVQKWKNRARTVARTEVVGAYNGGLHDAFAMIVENDPDTAWVKHWLATEDQRTRPDHREADGQKVPWAQPFNVGGFPMMYPHDPEGPPQEVINCRCTLLLEVEGEPTEMGNRQFKDGPTLASLVASWNPLEKRDRDGKWTKGGGLFKKLTKEDERAAGIYDNTPAHERKRLLKEYKEGQKARREAPVDHVVPPLPEASHRDSGEPSPYDDEDGYDDGYDDDVEDELGSHPDRIIGMPEGWPHDNPDPRYAAARNGADALAELPSIDNVAGGDAAAIYGTDGALRMNKSLAAVGADHLPPDEKKLMDSVDEATKPTRRDHDILLWRGMRNADQVFGSAWHGDVVGLEWTNQGFSSTSADWGVASGFASGPQGVLMRILVPKDAKVGGVDMRGKRNFNSHEAEGLLSRNVRYRITADYGVQKNGQRQVDAEIIE